MHPNDIDRKRTERALKSRERYRYVSVNISVVSGGYLIESPCCSRNIGVEGGVMDVAMLQHDGTSASWHVFRKDHKQGIWKLHPTHRHLAAVTDLLNTDPERVFWQIRTAGLLWKQAKLRPSNRCSRRVMMRLKPIRRCDRNTRTSPGSCDSSDLTETPFRSTWQFDLHLLDSADHCTRITDDPARATGVVLAKRRREP